MKTHLAGGFTENKTFSDIRSEEVVLYQLQANMMVQCASNLQRVLQAERIAHDIQSVTCYGMHCGGKFPLKILKLTVDFTNNSLSFEEHFNQRVDSVYYPPCIDRALKYIIEHV